MRRAGSSPRAWGILTDVGHLEGAVRFIPTCVGNTLWQKLERAAWPVHPHVRGEYVGFMVSPFLSVRFIPTCVGNTMKSCSYSDGLSVHPHVRGEYQKGRDLVDGAAGSSPRAWGIRQIDLYNVQINRFIPTCVGNTKKAVTSSMVRPVHPHVRGEYPRYAAIMRRQFGSSPRAWGILNVGIIGKKRQRFIPTCVGNTSCQGSIVTVISVHPHVRGEYCNLKNEG